MLSLRREGEHLPLRFDNWWYDLRAICLQSLMPLDHWRLYFLLGISKSHINLLLSGWIQLELTLVHWKLVVYRDRIGIIRVRVLSNFAGFNCKLTMVVFDSQLKLLLLRKWRHLTILKHLLLLLVAQKLLISLLVLDIKRIDHISHLLKVTRIESPVCIGIGISRNFFVHVSQMILFRFDILFQKVFLEFG